MCACRVMESVLRSIASLEQQTGGASDDVVHMDLGKNKWSFQEADNRSENCRSCKCIGSTVQQLRLSICNCAIVILYLLLGYSSTFVATNIGSELCGTRFRLNWQLSTCVRLLD